MTRGFPGEVSGWKSGKQACEFAFFFDPISFSFWSPEELALRRAPATAASSAAQMAFRCAKRQGMAPRRESVGKDCEIGRENSYAQGPLAKSKEIFSPKKYPKHFTQISMLAAKFARITLRLLTPHRFGRVYDRNRVLGGVVGYLQDGFTFPRVSLSIYFLVLSNNLLHSYTTFMQEFHGVQQTSLPTWCFFLWILVTLKVPNFICAYVFSKRALTGNVFGWFNFRFVC